MPKRPQDPDEEYLLVEASSYVDVLAQTRTFVPEDFEQLAPSVQEWVIWELDRTEYSSLVSLIPFKKYEALYNKAIKSQPLEDHPNLIASISEHHDEDARELLSFAFSNSQGAEACDNAAVGLAKTPYGLNVLTLALQGDKKLQQAGAIRGISSLLKETGSQQLIELLEVNLKHVNPRVRIRCLNALSAAKHLTSDHLESAMRDQDASVRVQAVGLIRNFDASVAKTYVSLLEDDKNYIVDDVLDNLIKGTSKMDEEAILDAILQELIVRASGRPSEYFNPAILIRALQALFQRNSRLYGQTLRRLADISFENTGPIRRRAVLIATSLDERSFIALANDYAENDPAAAKDVLNLISGTFDTNVIASQISATNPSDVQQNAANQIKLLARYHEDGLQQAKASFWWAIALTVVAFPLLIGMIYYLLATKVDSVTSIITSASTVIVQFIAGTLFYLYNQTRKQLTYYHRQMNQIQRFLLANSVAESLESKARETARIELVRIIASADAAGRLGQLDEQSS